LITIVLENPGQLMAPGGGVTGPATPGTETVVPADAHAVPLQACTLYEYGIAELLVLAGTVSEAVAAEPIGVLLRVQAHVVFAVVPAQVAARLTVPPALVSGLGTVVAVTTQFVGDPGAVGAVEQFSE
jgi:hypothetical protein